ncbi:envelope stress response membrane protein PspC [Natronospira bacteriovora]|uniref:Envelope stress response membrane protein PspC n=1 Tax=Natronospira bacteriovora TaxID=3069753 RepID=A0ABU0W8K6_9GAMM|nr:envelope stress response membrane protein PspC [Natronospira sp. AB-CW4]MDQ2070292.1 envelope stress response membrane protein PspC [Natronospira sp. AB-CW4]
MTRIRDIHGDEQSPTRLYRDPQNGWIAGVCAGLGDYFSISVAGVRFLTIVALFFFAPFVVVTYIVLALILPRRPQALYQGAEEEAMWRSMRDSPSRTLDTVRSRFRDLERRLQRMERYVTSDRYELDREFRHLDR